MSVRLVVRMLHTSVRTDYVCPIWSVRPQSFSDLNEIWLE